MHLKMKYIAAGGLVVSIFAAWLTVQTIQASIDYWLEEPESLTRGENSITIYSRNGGGELDGDFYLVLTFVNASFSKQTAQPYAQVDSTTVKFRFLLHKEESSHKMVYFSISENVERFSISLSLRKKNYFDMLKPNSIYPTSLSYEWIAESECFHCVEAT